MMIDDITPTPTQSCTACGEVKSIEEFSLARRGESRRRSWCKECRSARNRQYNAESYYPKNREKVREYGRAYYQRNRESTDARAREYARSHPEIDRNRTRRQRAEQAGAGVIDLTREQWDQQIEYFDHRCAYCYSKMDQDEMDHITPLSKGGYHSIDNVVPACGSCNPRKGNRSLVECLMKGLL